MLIYSNERVLPTDISMIVLAKDDSYYYVHRELYDQALLLAHKYRTLEELLTVLGDDGQNTTVRWFYAMAPKPLHTLAPFLIFSEEELAEDMDVCCGLLHVLASRVHLLGLIEQPMELRNKPILTKEERTGYEWFKEAFLRAAVRFHKSEPSPKEDKSKWSSIDANLKQVEEEDANLTSQLAGFSRVREEEIDHREVGRVATLAERKMVRKLLEG